MWSELCHLSFGIQNPWYTLLEGTAALYMLQNTNVFLCFFPVLSFPLHVDVLCKCVCSGRSIGHHHTLRFEVLVLRQSTPNTLASGTSLWFTRQLSMSPALLRAWTDRKLPSKQTNYYHLRVFFFLESNLFSSVEYCESLGLTNVCLKTYRLYQSWNPENTDAALASYGCWFTPLKMRDFHCFFKLCMVRGIRSICMCMSISTCGTYVYVCVCMNTYETGRTLLPISVWRHHHSASAFSSREQ